MHKLIDWDARLTGRMRIAEQPGMLRRLAILLAHSGDSWFWGLGLITLILFADGDWSRLGVIWLAGILATAVVVFAIKLIVRRKRPEGDWGEIYRKTDPHSFPSGHAARCVMLGVVAFGFAPAWLGGVLLGWAVLVGAARVAMGVHYLVDVLAGMLLGMVMGAGIVLIVNLV